MKKQKIKIRGIKSKIKIIELNKPSQNKPISNNSNQDSSSGVLVVSSLESKASTSSLPLIKSAPIESRQSLSQQKERAEKDTNTNTDERIFNSYERFSMSDSQKRKTYSLDIRGESASKPAPIISNSNNSPVFSAPSNELRHLEKASDGRTIDSFENNHHLLDLRKEYSDEHAAKYRPKKSSDFF